MMYYWIVKHAGSKVQDIVSHHEDLYTLQYPHIIIESLSPGLNGASFALGRRISTDSTWRDLNNSLVTYLKSQHVRKSKVELPLGVNLGTVVVVKNPTARTKATFFKSRGGVFSGLGHARTM